MNELETLFTIAKSRAFETTERGEKQYVVEGVAATEHPDQDGETMLTKSMDFSPLLESGWINWDHKEDPANLIGVPLNGLVLPNHDFFVSGKLLVDDKAQAKETWDLIKACEKNPNLNRRIGWSVQGAAQRNGALIVKSVVRQLALSHQPVNTRTWASFAKSMAATTDTMQPLTKEYLDDLWGECKNQCYDKQTKVFTNKRRGLFEHLVNCKGLKPKTASTIMKQLIDSTSI